MASDDFLSLSQTFQLIILKLQSFGLQVSLCLWSKRAHVAQGGALRPSHLQPGKWELGFSVLLAADAELR